MLCPPLISLSQIQGRAEFFDRNSCTFGHKLGKRLIGDYHLCASKVVLSPFVFVAFRFPSSCFILAHLFLHPFPMASSALSGTCLWFRRFFRCLLHVRSYVFSLVVISLWLTHLWFLTQAYGVPLQNLNAKFELEAKRFSIAFFATVPGWVLKCISFWHSNLPNFKTIYLLTTSVNAKYYLWLPIEFRNNVYYSVRTKYWLPIQLRNNVYYIV